MILVRPNTTATTTTTAATEDYVDWDQLKYVRFCGPEKNAAWTNPENSGHLAAVTNTFIFICS